MSSVRRSQCSMCGSVLDCERSPAPYLLAGGILQAVDRLTDDAAHVHLADADALADLGLRQVVLEAQAQDLALALAQDAHQALDRRAVLGVAEPGVIGAEGRAQAVAVLVVLARAVQADGAVGGSRLAGLE